MELLVADIGGTHARLAVVDIEAAGPPALSIEVRRFEVFQSAQFDSLAAIFTRFLAMPPAPRVAVIGIAGGRYGDEVRGVALPWVVSIAHTQDALGLDELHVINDFEAAAYGTQQLGRRDLTLLSAARDTSATGGPILVIGPGTGFGAALLVSDEGRCLALASEAGQAAFAPTTDLEIELLRLLRRGGDYVSNGDVLSGPGLARIEWALHSLRGEPRVPRAPAAVTRAALEEGDPIASQALQLFCSLAGSIAGDLALIHKARGGVFVAGGILPRIKRALLDSRFMERFVAKGAMRRFLQAIPVKLVEHGQLGVLGAARWYATRR